MRQKLYFSLGNRGGKAGSTVRKGYTEEPNNGKALVKVRQGPLRSNEEDEDPGQVRRGDCAGTPQK